MFFRHYSGRSQYAGTPFMILGVSAGLSFGCRGPLSLVGAVLFNFAVPSFEGSFNALLFVAAVPASGVSIAVFLMTQVADFILLFS